MITGSGWCVLVRVVVGVAGPGGGNYHDMLAAVPSWGIMGGGWSWSRAGCCCCLGGRTKPRSHLWCHCCLLLLVRTAAAPPSFSSALLRSAPPRSHHG